MQARVRELEILATTGWLAETPAEFRDAVLDRCVLKRHRRGDAIYRAGDPAGGLYGLIRGGVAVEVSSNEREPYIGAFARPGFWIGEGSLLTRRPRFVGVRARQDSVFAYLSIAEWDRIARADAEAWRWFAHLMLGNELMAVAVADALLTPGAAGRLAAILLILTNQGTPPAAAPAIEASQDDLAQMANLSRSSATRLLRSFEAEGLIEYSYRRVRVVDAAGLRRRKAGL